MNRRAVQHLTDADFSNLLFGEEPDDLLAAHLADCQLCKQELVQVRASLSAFGDISSRWAEGSAPARVPVPSRWALGLAGWPTLATGALVTALTGVLVFHFGPAAHMRSADQASSALTSRTAVPTKTELADDNRLMLSIDEELSYRARPGVRATDLAGEAESASDQAAASVVN